MNGGVGDAGSQIRYVTRVELALLMEVADLVDEPPRLVREGVVGEGGDPGSASVVDWVGSVAVERCIDRS